MRGKWSLRIRRLHTWLGVFFAPLLLLFIATGWWQTFSTEDSKGALNDVMSKASSIHTDDYFSLKNGHHHSSTHFKYLVALMALSLIATILMGLALAFQNSERARGVAIALVLGILVPLLILYFN